MVGPLRDATGIPFPSSVETRWSYASCPGGRSPFEGLPHFVWASTPRDGWRRRAVPGSGDRDFAHWKAGSDRSLCGAGGDQCANPRSNRVASVQSPAVRPRATMGLVVYGNRRKARWPGTEIGEKRARQGPLRPKSVHDMPTGQTSAMAYGFRDRRRTRTFAPISSDTQSAEESLLMKGYTPCAGGLYPNSRFLRIKKRTHMGPVEFLVSEAGLEPARPLS